MTNPPSGTWSYRPITQTEDGFDIGDWTPSTTCPEGNRVATVPSQPNNVYCAGLRKEVEDELVPKKEEKFFTFGLDWEVSPTTVASFLYNYHDSVNTTNFGYFNPLTENPLTNDSLIVSRAKAIELGIVDETATEDYFQLFAESPEQPLRKFINTNTSQSAIASLDGDLGESDWSYSSSLSWASARAERKGENIFNRNAQANLITNPDTPLGEDPLYIPIDPNRDIAGFLNTYTDLERHSLNTTLAADFFASTEFGELPGGPIGFGIGAAVSKEDFEQVPDSRDVIDRET
ncbi:MAG: hypothetical protein HRU19_20535 [Pseudobacteriovorax sp.]|nr:hypothetical protein [Pseudobacteriovorax sp.]